VLDWGVVALQFRVSEEDCHLTSRPPGDEHEERYGGSWERRLIENPAAHLAC